VRSQYIVSDDKDLLRLGQFGDAQIVKVAHMIDVVQESRRPTGRAELLFFVTEQVCHPERCVSVAWRLGERQGECAYPIAPERFLSALAVKRRRPDQ
jgi:hypothetical protein